jgi:hypothetical protein
MQNYYPRTQTRTSNRTPNRTPTVYINHKLNKSNDTTKEGRMEDNIEKKQVEFTPEIFRNLKTCIDDAVSRLQGDKSKDIPATDHLDDEWTAIDTLNTYFNKIEDVITSTYKDEGRRQAQSILKNSFSILVETAKAEAPHLTEKYDKVIRPRLYDTKVLTDVVKSLCMAQAKLHGDTSFDVPSTSRFKDDGFDPLDNLYVSFDTITDILNTDYVSPEYTQMKSKIVSACFNILNITERRPIYMGESYNTLVNTMKTKYGFKLVDKKELNNDSGNTPPF